jgi:hypothetical protein
MQIDQFQYIQDAGWSPPLNSVLDSERTLVLVFGATAFGRDAAPFQQLRAAFQRAVIVGCSSAGEIAGDRVQDDGITVAVVRFDHTALRYVHARVNSPKDSEAIGVRLATQLNTPGLRAVFVLSDGLNVNGSALVHGFNRTLGTAVTITGGLAGDGADFRRTWVLQEDVPAENIVCAVGLYGERLRIGAGCDGGWLAFGPQRRITRAEGNVLYELDGKPALDLYKTYLGDLAAGLPGSALLFPLAVQLPGAASTSSLVRTILGVDEKRRAMIFAGNMPMGWEARLMRTTNEGLIGSAAVAASRARHGANGEGPALAVSVSCVGRRLVLGERTDEELETIVENFGAGTVHVGFYSYGEIAAAQQGGACELHNQTMTVTALSEV